MVSPCSGWYPHYIQVKPFNQSIWTVFKTLLIYLVGGLEHEFYDFPYIGNNDPNCRTHIFQGDETTNQILSNILRFLTYPLENSLSTKSREKNDHAWRFVAVTPSRQEFYSHDFLPHDLVARRDPFFKRFLSDKHGGFTSWTGGGWPCKMVTSPSNMIPSGKLTVCYGKLIIYSRFSHWKWWFSIVMLVYQRVIYGAFSFSWRMVSFNADSAWWPNNFLSNKDSDTVDILSNNIWENVVSYQQRWWIQHQWWAYNDDTMECK